MKRLAKGAAALLAVACVVSLAGVAITGCAAFGGTPEGERLARARQSPAWHDGRFTNAQPMWADARGAWLEFAFGPSTPAAQPDAPVPVVHLAASAFDAAPASGLRITWFGHSSTLVEIDGAKVLIDPFWSERASPVSWAGPQRWYAPPLALGELPEIDAVVISHDHYDHLDQAAISALAATRAVFVVPLGVGAHLARWGVPAQRIIELDWWQSTPVAGLEIVATPARHASGRVPARGDKTLWAGYAIVGTQHRAWYSGDTGFHDELPRIGERLGPFDVTLIESGQYGVHWPDTHLGPEQAVEAHRLVRGKTLLPVHWALLKLARHGWTEPVERVLAAARCRGVDVLVPRPGEAVEPTTHPALARWWPAVPWQSAAESPLVATRRGQPGERVETAPGGCASEARQSQL